MLVSDIFLVFIFTAACVGFTLEMFVGMYMYILLTVLTCVEYLSVRPLVFVAAVIPMLVHDQALSKGHLGGHQAEKQRALEEKLEQ